MRLLALVVLFALVAAPAQASGPGRLEFEILRNGQPDGRHIVEVTRSAEGLRASSIVDMEVRIGPLTVFRLEQSCRETWTPDGLNAFDCSTMKDGRRSRVTGRRGANAIVVDSGDGEARFALTAAPATWWVRPPLGERSLINPETGRPMEARVSYHPGERIRVGGREVSADRVRVEGALTLDLWYDAQGRWIGCAFRARGQRIEYRLVTPIEEAPRGLV